jgi:hypothetical protein
MDSVNFRDPFEPTPEFTQRMEPLRQNCLEELRKAVGGGAPDDVIRAALDYLLTFESATRPRKVIELLTDDTLGLSDETRWRLIHSEWNAFDAIPHRDFAILFNRYRSAWRADYLNAADFLEEDNRKFYDTLPDRFVVYRGQSALHVAGLSWTLDHKVAAGFARGHRCFWNKYPVVISATISKKNVAGAYVGREESEIVIFTPQCAYARKYELIEPHKHEAWK